MPTRIRLKRVGAKKNPHYRIVVMASSKPRDGAPVEELGHYDPRSTDAMPVFNNEDRALHWLMVGAQPSETAKSLLRKAGIWAKFAAARDKHPSAGIEAPAVPAAPEPVTEDEAEEAPVAPADPEPVAEAETEEAPAEE